MELKELYLKGRKSFEKNGFECPGIETRAILASSLGTDPLELYAHPQRRVGSKRAEAFERLLHRRLAGEPLAYVTGEREFYSRPFAVTPDVLIPRPETETLAELAIETAGQMKNPRVLDLGTGSGCIALTVFLETRGCRVFASDVSAAALWVARKNAGTHGARIQFVNSDLLGCFAKSSFDIIISNPPYVSQAQYESLSREIRCYEPRSALVGGEDGLAYIRKITAGATRALREGGFLLLEIGAGQAQSVEGIVRENGFSDIRFETDIGDIRRVVKATWKK
ncbi:MAG: peptide chain release factor N(5)-glutamine methyltransferase [Candidatus Dadabacteria bacterium]|nr:peptide chain release factor N(5)-glutamine methyltransferase [Candidatus Dadabacteria bacterium]MYA48707.1 peptide chain release factor N(5)-glutamine methyltransferase [Candidatus Dadabacteria bacterium]MYF48080.1 peptide chain release factor N(5)-glutamine methyltransferase [Candidatus Dadabacteria bacterium]MYG83368.1 peptide chain release factor N(5)-glutamine methyltransferase [Candidatus Dadabacteria bacterium]MYK49692.1 peptide chain release factor N(5)-glutamine methyltransferase [C